LAKLNVILILLAACVPQEEMQKAAFEALQLQKDSVHGYIRSQVSGSMASSPDGAIQRDG
jgi:hypothetical protein